MTIYWVRTEKNDALSVLEAVERALDTGTMGHQAMITGRGDPSDPTNGDPYLAENLSELSQVWAVDANQIVVSNRPVLAVVINALQRLIKRGAWWFLLPQWQQISTFHGVSVRVIDSLLEHLRQLRERLHVLEAASISPEHAKLLEEHIRLLRMEQQVLHNRIAALEAQQADYASSNSTEATL